MKNTSRENIFTKRILNKNMTKHILSHIKSSFDDAFRKHYYYKKI